MHSTSGTISHTNTHTIAQYTKGLQAIPLTLAYTMHHATTPMNSLGISGATPRLPITTQITRPLVA